MTNLPARAATLLFVLCCTTTALSHEKKPPSEAVTVAGSLGETNFPNSGAAAAQPDFMRGLLLLHSFEFDAARESFRAAQARDPGFVMAYWGEALSHNMPIWGERFGDDATDPDEREPITQGRVAVLIAYLKTIQVDLPTATPK